MDDLQDLARLANALRPWLGELVIVGGWAHRLYRMLPNVPTLAYQPLRTRDADVAFSATSSLAGNMGAALKAAGFREELAGEHTPPVTWYRLGGHDHGFYVESLAPLVGSGTKRDGTDDATLAKAGVTAQKLRYIDLLLTSPWTIHPRKSRVPEASIPVRSEHADSATMPAMAVSMAPAWFARRWHGRVSGERM